MAVEVSLAGRPCLKSTMKVLLKVAHNTIVCKVSGAPCDLRSESAEMTVATQPAAVHALNILRALYRDSKLGEHVMQFIPEGVVLAISGYGAQLWPVRRASCMLNSLVFDVHFMLLFI